MTVLKTETETAVFPAIPTETDRVLTIQNRYNTNGNDIMIQISIGFASDVNTLVLFTKQDYNLKTNSKTKSSRPRLRPRPMIPDLNNTANKLTPRQQLYLLAESLTG